MDKILKKYPVHLVFVVVGCKPDMNWRCFKMSHNQKHLIESQESEENTKLEAGF